MGAVNLFDGPRMRVVSNGTPRGTRVLDADGQPVKFGVAGLTKVELVPITADCAFVQAVLTIDGVGLGMDTNVGGMAAAPVSCAPDPGVIFTFTRLADLPTASDDVGA
jgi:hypothetical protein